MGNNASENRSEESFVGLAMAPNPGYARPHNILLSFSTSRFER